MPTINQEKLIRELEGIDWQYEPKDPAALNELKGRIADIGERFSLISYSDLVKGVDFSYPNINDGRTYRISVYEWTGLNRRILGDCLGYISMESCKEAGFMASALVIGRNESMPSEIFFNWMKDLGVLPDTRDDTKDRFWIEQVNYAHQWYKYGRKAPNWTESI